MPRKTSQLAFDQAILELESVVKKLEAGEVTLEESIELYKQGINLAKDCHNLLEKAEQQVQKISIENGSYRLETVVEKDGD
ncbi:exodeoxyribonuclease VII small subunit [Desulfuribacillus alkaliarsenatis]|uniref:Exodeoxyribonuclease 7 small subunit n=1 Tax=Desulfuribacillus alkaliarsenatis TaxID=766136 RepID=A0A1E5G5J8_9FIRM|nr:exodeoxyribonuclease VII small subunit [Desulfuribacillus alkaliarsenatis]OEF98448.1 exodeoxyribonuclease VII small subunit [Desulfuribacillus alkaliarsenatis]